MATRSGGALQRRLPHEAITEHAGLGHLPWALVVAAVAVWLMVVLASGPRRLLGVRRPRWRGPGHEVHATATLAVVGVLVAADRRRTPPS